MLTTEKRIVARPAAGEPTQDEQQREVGYYYCKDNHILLSVTTTMVSATAV